MTNTVPEHIGQWYVRAAVQGWEPVSDDSCPRRLVGKRSKEYGGCWCGAWRTGMAPSYQRLNDHGATWRDVGDRSSRGTTFVLWEPYGADGEDLCELIAVAEADGLRVRITASVWNPPSTVGIKFERATA